MEVIVICLNALMTAAAAARTALPEHRNLLYLLQIQK
jgi:hypothetical protein